jgi:hypothetical protein
LRIQLADALKHIETLWRRGPGIGMAAGGSNDERSDPYGSPGGIWFRSDAESLREGNPLLARQAARAGLGLGNDRFTVMPAVSVR